MSFTRFESEITKYGEKLEFFEFMTKRIIELKIKIDELEKIYIDSVRI